MKLGCQTILWGATLDDPRAIFKTIHDLGFEGVEICQPPAALPPPDTLQSILEDKESKLELLGLYGGRLEDRVAYSKSFRPPFGPRYLCVEDWTEPDCPAAIAAGFKLALHPHMFKRVHNFASASGVLKDHPELLFLPDTAHLFAARNDPNEAIEKHAMLLAGIHIKDWTSRYGRSFHRYARGFVELGRGDVCLERILATLKAIKYEGWLIFEQDSTTFSPRESLQISLEWLSRNGFKVNLEKGPQLPSTLGKPRRKPLENGHGMEEFIANLIDVRHLSLENFARLVLRTLQSVVKFDMAALWEYSPTTDLLSLFASDQFPVGVINPTVNCSTDINGLAVSSHTVQFLDPYAAPPGRICAHESILRQLNVTQLISVPVLNTYNCNHVELIVNLHRRTAATDVREVSYIQTLLAACAEFIAIAYESLLEDQCQAAGTMVNLAVVGTHSSADFLQKVVKITHDSLGCEGVTIFLGDEANQKLIPQATTGLIWKDWVAPNERYYDKGKGLTGQVWESGYPQLTNHPEKEPGYLGKSTEKTSDRTRTSLCAPIRDPQGMILGVIRCINKRQRQRAPECEVFGESDLSIVAAIEQAMVPHLMVLTNEERRAWTVSRLTHEIKVPFSVIRGGAELLNQEAAEYGYQFSHN